MAKIVTDQIQRQSGSEFTLPLKDGSNGSPLVTDGNGNLTFGQVNLTNSSVTFDGKSYQISPSFFEAGTSYVRPTLVTGQQSYTSPGTYTWVAPADVYSVSVVAVGGGGPGIDSWANSAGSGGGLGWKNNIRVTPGTSYTVQVGAGGRSDTSATQIGATGSYTGGNSYFNTTNTVAGYGGGNANGYSTGGPNANGYGGGYVGDGGGAGGNATEYQAGAGAGGYIGRGGNSRETWNASTINGGYGGGYYSSTYGSGAGGGVGLNGITGYSSPGNAFYNPFSGYNNTSSNGSGGQGAHGGGNGMYGENPFSGQGQSSSNIQGGDYGGGGGGPGTSWPSASGNGGVGAVRIIWGPGRSYPFNAA
jgi:hypothetical protein